MKLFVSHGIEAVADGSGIGGVNLVGILGIVDVLQGDAKVPHLEYEFEVFQSDPLAALDALEDVVLLEGDHQAPWACSRRPDTK